MNLIVAVDSKWGIGKKNQLLFQIYPDMRHFVQKTKSGVVIMGRKTLESLPEGKPLRDRVNIVLTRNPERLPSHASDGQRNLILCQNLIELRQALDQLDIDDDRVWVIGGAEIYALLLPYCREAYVTKVMAAEADADCWMVNLDAEDGWSLAEEGGVQEWEGLRFRFCMYSNSSSDRISQSDRISS